MKQHALALAAGVVFAAGLGISEMTNPEKVVGFLDVAGPWDPSLAFVMIGAIAVHMGAARWALRAPRPLWASRFSLGSKRKVDLPLIGGAALFGLGWGTAGYCPGPAVVDLAAPSRSLIVFVVAMIAGIALYHRARLATWERSDAPSQAPSRAPPS